MPGNKKATPTKEWRYSTDFSEYHEEFPELVTENGAGWYYRHVHALADDGSVLLTKIAGTASEINFTGLAFKTGSRDTAMIALGSVNRLRWYFNPADAGSLHVRGLRIVDGLAVTPSASAE